MRRKKLKKLGEAISQVASLEGNGDDHGMGYSPEEKRLAMCMVRPIRKDLSGLPGLINQMITSENIGAVATIILAISFLIKYSPILVADKPLTPIDREKPTDITRIYHALFEFLGHPSPTIRMRTALALRAMVTTPSPYGANQRFCAGTAILHIEKLLRKAVSKERDQAAKAEMAHTLEVIESYYQEERLKNERLRTERLRNQRSIKQKEQK